MAVATPSFRSKVMEPPAKSCAIDMAQQHTDPVNEDSERPLPPKVWRRGEEPEFTRLATFTDGVYAIALTLLVLGLDIGHLVDPDSPGALWSALNDLIPDLVAFAVAFVLLGRYWVAHHDFYSTLRAIDQGLMGLSLIYLAFVAFLPFPTKLIGVYEGNPVALLLFATTLAAVSGMETVMFAHAHRRNLLRSGLPPSVFKWGVIASLQPVVLFVVTMPFAFLSTTGVLISWAVISPLLGMWVDRHAPVEAPGSDLPLIAARRKIRPQTDDRSQGK